MATISAAQLQQLDQLLQRAQAKLQASDGDGVCGASSASPPLACAVDAIVELHNAFHEPSMQELMRAVSKLYNAAGDEWVWPTVSFVTRHLAARSRLLNERVPALLRSTSGLLERLQTRTEAHWPSLEDAAYAAVHVLNDLLCVAQRGRSGGQPSLCSAARRAGAIRGL